MSQYIVKYPFNITVEEHRRTACSRTRSRESLTALGMAAAIAATSPGGTRHPAWGAMSSGIPPRANATTGVPHAIASATTSP
jgi:hypothetical protein